MKIARALNPINLTAIFPWRFPVSQLFALFHYLIKSYDLSFLKVFMIFEPFCFSAKPFPNAPNITPKSVTLFSILYIIWSYPSSFEFCVHLLLIKIKDSTLYQVFRSLLISPYFRTFCNHLLVHFLNHTIQSFSFLSVSFI